MDEIYSGKRYKYLTIVLDLETSVVVYISEDKGADALKPFFPRLKPSKAKIAAISMDMPGGYKKAMREYLPKVPVILDRFHVIKRMNEKLSNLRRELAREATDKLQVKVLRNGGVITSRFVSSSFNRTPQARALDRRQRPEARVPAACG